MKNYFIYDNLSFTYLNLFDDVINSKYYFTSLKLEDPYSFFLNLIVAIVNDKNIELLDDDVQDREIESMYEQIQINSKGLKTLDDLIKNILQSTSEISLFTSGTTGQPKKVVHTINSLTRSVKISDNYKDHIWGFAYNPTHMAGLQVFFQALLNKNTLVYIFGKNRNRIYETIENLSITHISATPTFYRLLLPFEKSFPSVSRITFGGEKSDTRLHEIILKIFPKAKVNNIYASTEAGTLFSANGEFFKIPAHLYGKVKIDANELLIHTSLLGKSEIFESVHDFYKTGDLVEWIDEENKIFKFTNRKNEMINVGGYKVNPLEVEETIIEITEVVNSLVYSKKNSILGNLLCAEIVRVEGSNLSEANIRQYLSDKLPDFKIPRKITFVNNLSITRTGKIKRS